MNTVPVQWGESAPATIPIQTGEQALKVAIAGAIAATDTPKARLKALSSIKWRLRSPAGQYAGLEGLRGVLTDAEHAQTYDGRDNEETKIKFWSAILGVQMAVELVSFSV